MTSVFTSLFRNTVRLSPVCRNQLVNKIHDVRTNRRLEDRRQRNWVAWCLILVGVHRNKRSRRW